MVVHPTVLRVLLFQNGVSILYSVSRHWIQNPAIKTADSGCSKITQTRDWHPLTYEVLKLITTTELSTLDWPQTLVQATAFECSHGLAVTLFHRLRITLGLFICLSKTAPQFISSEICQEHILRVVSSIDGNAL